ncbi:hypothetical protein E0H26_21170 [Micromonospora zingiberis]|uniref:Uncharacterized protein n=1 Tax=Micromonospora zingiberis TaxID=2053011 RepID=A0A4R0GGE8_9ACTN|nr:hypothetical protein [Micromonospora zingiberis]TCB94438.1 hypothetical protein E0H26_21170 [Micromonospora zingiberis]
MTEQKLIEPPGRREMATSRNTAVDRARRFLSVITVLFWMSLARSLAFSTFASVALASLGMALPTLRYFETSTYAHANFTFEIDHLLDQESEAALREVASDGGYVSFVRFSNVDFGFYDKTQGRVELLLTRDPDKIDLSWFSDQHVVESAPAPAGHWIDLSAHLASTLDAEPGDAVNIQIGDGVYTPTVRRILAVRYATSDYVAVGPMPSNAEIGLGSMPPLEPTIAALTTNRSAHEVESLLASSPKGDSALVSATADLRASSEAEVTAGFRVVLTISVLAYLAIAGLAIREAIALVHRNGRSMALLQILGVRRRKLVRGVAVVESLIVAVGISLGIYLSASVIYQGFLFPALPPGYQIHMASAGAGATLVYFVVAWVTLTNRTWRWSNRSPFPRELE